MPDSESPELLENSRLNEGPPEVYMSMNAGMHSEIGRAAMALPGPKP